MRRKEKQIADPQELVRVLCAAKFLTVAMIDDGRHYLVSLSHGHDAQRGCISFHCASEGRKIDAVSGEERRLRSTAKEKVTMILIVQNTVRDYDAWKLTFDDHESVRAKYGFPGHTIYRDVNDPNSVTLLLKNESRERAEEFVRDPSLAEAMERGGVTSEPRVSWLEEAETTAYAGRRAA
jgi:hypothetical protein